MKNWRTCLALIVGLLATTLAAPQRNAADPEVQLKAAQQKALLDGDLKGAIEIYKSVADAHGVNHATAVKALKSMAEAYKNLGETENAQKTWERIIRDFSDQPAAVVQAKAAVGALSTSAAGMTKSEADPRKLLSLQDSSLPGAISPDGRYYANKRFFFFGQAAEDGLNIRELATVKDELLVKDEGGLTTDPVFSPDGKQIAYRWVTRGGAELRTIEVHAKAGPSPHVVLRGANEANYRPFTWSADGTRLFVVLTSEDNTHQLAAVSVADGMVTILKPLDWKMPRKLSASPDGQSVAYDIPLAQDSTNRNIVILSTDGKREEPITRGEQLDTIPSWTPDSNALVYLSNQSGYLGLWQIQVADGAPKGKPVLVRDRISGDLYPLGFLSDGSFYYESTEFSRDVFTADIDLSEGRILKPPKRLTNRTFSSSPAWSPDGAWLAYLTDHTGGSKSVVIRSAASTDEHEIPTGFPIIAGLTWSPDSQSVVFCAPSNDGGPSTLHEIQIGPQKTRDDFIKRTVQCQPGSGSPAFSSEGRRVYLPSGFSRGGIKMYDLVTGRESDITKDPVQKFLVTSDDQIVFRSVGGIGVVSSSGGTVRTLQAPPNSSPVKVSDDRKRLLVQQGAAESGPLWWVPMDGGAAQRIGTGAYPRIASLHPDGKRIAIDRETTGNTELWVEKDLLSSSNSQSKATKAVFTAQINPASGKIIGSATRLTGSATWDARAAWSPDGKSIAFKRQTDGGNYEIVVYSLATKTERRYPRNNGAALGGGPPRWFPDGRALLQVNNDSNLQPELGFERLDLDTGEFHPIPELNFRSANPLTAFSSDRKTLYAIGSVAGADPVLVVFDLATKQRKNAIKLPDIRGIRAMALSPDSRTVAICCATDSGGKPRLARVSTDGSGYTELYSGSVRYIAWTKDGRGILFGESDDSDNWRIMRIDAKGGGNPEFTGLQVKGLETIDISPDGAHIAFSGFEATRSNAGRTAPAAQSASVLKPITTTPRPLVRKPAAQAKETASIVGVVVKMGTNEPVSDVEVELTRVEGSAAAPLAAAAPPAPPGAASKPAVEVLPHVRTTDTGVFAFPDLKPGKYTLVAMQAGNAYMPAEYGQRDPKGRGIALPIAEGQAVKDIKLEMAPTSSITGRVLDANSEAAGHATVFALQPQYKQGEQRLSIVQSVVTDEQGNYRLFWLPPGRYYVAAKREDHLRRQSLPVFIRAPGTTESNERSSVPAVSHRTLPYGEVVEEIDAPVYYGGSVDMHQAQAIELRPGASFAGADVALGPGRMRAHHIRGVFIGNPSNPQAAPIQGGGAFPYGQVNAVSLASSPDLFALHSAIEANGSFDLEGAVPGIYVLRAQGGGAAGAGFLVVQVGSADAENVKVVAEVGQAIPGKVTIEGRPPLNSDPELANIRVVLHPDFFWGPAGGQTLVNSVNASGVFNFPSRHTEFTIEGIPENTYIKAVRMGSTDLLATMRIPYTEGLGPVDIVLGSDVGSLAGIVVNDKQTRLANAVVALVPDALTLRNRFDLYKSATTDVNGRFQIPTVPAGDYRLFAWEYEDPNAWQDAEFLRSYEAAGILVHVTDGSKQENLTLTVNPTRR